METAPVPGEGLVAPVSPEHMRQLAGDLYELLRGLAEEYEALEARGAKLLAENARLRGVKLDQLAEPTVSLKNSLARSAAGAWPAEPRFLEEASVQEELAADTGSAADFRDACSELDTCSQASCDAGRGRRGSRDHEATCSGSIDITEMWSGDSTGSADGFRRLHATVVSRARARSPSEFSARSVVSFACSMSGSARAGPSQARPPEGEPAGRPSPGADSSPRDAHAQSDGLQPSLPEAVSGGNVDGTREVPPEMIGRPLEIEVPSPSWARAAAGLSPSPASRLSELTVRAEARRDNTLDDICASQGARQLARRRPWSSGTSGTSTTAPDSERVARLLALLPASSPSPARRRSRGQAYEADHYRTEDIGEHSSRPHERASIISGQLSPRRWLNSLKTNGPMTASYSRRRVLVQRAEGPRRWLQYCVLSPPFDMFSGVLILTNMIYMGIQANMSLQQEFLRLEGHPKTQDWVAVELVFSVLFFSELLLRAAGLGQEFIRGPDRRWHLLEVFMVLISLPELLGNATGVDLSLLRAMRLFRIFRFLQIAGDSVLVENLRTVMHSLGKSMYCFSPVVLLLGAVLYVFACVFMQSVSAYLLKVTPANLEDEETKKTVQAIQKYFGSMGTTLMTLFMCISGGDSWVYAMEPLEVVGAVTQALFVAYIAFVLFALLNILNGLFVDAAVQSASVKRKLAVDAAVEDIHQMTQEITNMVSDADQDCNGVISRDELLAYIQNERTRACFESLDLDVTSLVRIFEELDASGDGSIDVAGFVQRCVELRGVAKKADIALMESHIFKHLRDVEDTVSGLIKDEPRP